MLDKKKMCVGLTFTLALAACGSAAVLALSTAGITVGTEGMFLNYAALFTAIDPKGMYFGEIVMTQVPAKFKQWAACFRLSINRRYSVCYAHTQLSVSNWTE
jgi:hypothetical protein